MLLPYTILTGFEFKTNTDIRQQTDYVGKANWRRVIHLPPLRDLRSFLVLLYRIACSTSSAVYVKQCDSVALVETKANISDSGDNKNMSYWFGSSK